MGITDKVARSTGPHELLAVGAVTLRRKAWHP
jgi:hypothetical protein